MGLLNELQQDDKISKREKKPKTVCTHDFALQAQNRTLLDLFEH
jgi:hypothetical protein